MPRLPLNREQAWLLPPSLDDLLPPDHPARFVAALVGELDEECWRELGVDPEPERRGAPSYPPEALLSVWLYGFMTGVRSSRRLEEACRERIPFLWLAGRHRPDHNTLWRFYRLHRDRMRMLLRRTVEIAVAADLLDLALRAVDGTKVAGSASRERTLGREGLARLLVRTDEAIADLEAQNETGGDAAPPGLPGDLAKARALRERVREALREVEGSGGRRHANLTDPDASLLRTPAGHVTGYNAQAAASALRPARDAASGEEGEDGGGGGGGGGGLFITGAGVAASGDDHPELLAMIEQSEENTRSAGGAGVRTVTAADAGYHSGAVLEAAARAGRVVLAPGANVRKRAAPFDKSRFTYNPEEDSYTCPHGRTLAFAGTVRRHSRSRGGGLARRYRARGPACRACPSFAQCTGNPRGRTLEAGPHEQLLTAHQALMETEWARSLYGKRRQLIEPVFGIIKEQMGLQRFLLRGIENVRSEWTLIAAAFNMRTLHRIWAARLGPSTGGGNTPSAAHAA